MFVYGICFFLSSKTFPDTFVWEKPKKLNKRNAEQYNSESKAHSQKLNQLKDISKEVEEKENEKQFLSSRVQGIPFVKNCYLFGIE